MAADARARRPLSIAILASGEGTTLDALADRVGDGTLPARIALVLTNRADVGAIARARRHGLTTVVVPNRGVRTEEWADHVTQELTARGTELVVLAGFLAILPPSWVRRWSGRAINLHPALLPRYGGRGMYGDRVHRAVLASGDALTGVTVHLVTAAIDGGPILAQAKVAVLADDSPERLRARLHPIEVELVADTIRRFAEGALPLPYPEPDAPAPPRRDGADDAA